MIRPDSTVVREIEEMRPKTPPGLLSRSQKDRLIERGLYGLYRWYVEKSQATRNWNADRSFDWKSFSTSHSEPLNHVLEGFFAVEQYIPDYVSKLLVLIKKSRGRHQFQLRWGSEEEKHSDAWLNTLTFSRHRSVKWIEDYQESLLNTEWMLPWDDPMHMLFYTLIQERATQINYLNTALIARGQSDKQELQGDVDPVLDRVATTIATDEGAHYAFFLEASRLMFYYYPAESLEAFVDVVKHFCMPATETIPDFARFEETCARTAIYGPREHTGDVLQVVLNQLGVKGHKAFVDGVRRSRRVPDEDGNLRDTALFEALDYGTVEDAVKRLFGRIKTYEEEVGFAAVNPTEFVPSGLMPADDEDA